MDGMTSFQLLSRVQQEYVYELFGVIHVGNDVMYVAGCAKNVLAMALVAVKFRFVNVGRLTGERKSAVVSANMSAEVRITKMFQNLTRHVTIELAGKDSKVACIATHCKHKVVVS